MASVRLNVSLPEETFLALSKHVEPRKRSRFINTAVRLLLKEKQAEKLAAEYREASRQIRRINCDLEGTLSDGLD
jgi:metal-responsive CopG/Arc/MetJ family transcriptional regulator